MQLVGIPQRVFSGICLCAWDVSFEAAKGRLDQLEKAKASASTPAAKPGSTEVGAGSNAVPGKTPTPPRSQSTGASPFTPTQPTHRLPSKTEMATPEEKCCASFFEKYIFS